MSWTSPLAFQTSSPMIIAISSDSFGHTFTATLKNSSFVYREVPVLYLEVPICNFLTKNSTAPIGTKNIPNKEERNYFKKILHNFRYDYYWAALCSITTAVDEIVNCSQLWYDINHFSNVISLQDRIIYSRDGIRIGISFSPNNSLAVFSYYLSYSVHYG